MATEPIPQSFDNLVHVVPVQSGRVHDEPIDLTTLFWSWVKWSWLIALGVVAGAYYGYRHVENFSPAAVAVMIVAPAGAEPQSPNSGLAAAAAQFGLQLGGASNSASLFDRFKLVLGSIQLAQVMQDKYGLMQRIYAASWDASSQTFVRPTGRSFEREQARRAFFHLNVWTPPNLENLASYLSGALKIQAAKTPGFVTISVTNPDPVFAEWLLSTTFKEADDLLRAIDRKDSDDRRSYIESQMQGRALVYMQDAFRNMLVQELSKQAALQSDRPYSASVVDAPRVLNALTEPDIAIAFAAPMVAGGIGAFILVTLIAVIRRERK